MPLPNPSPAFSKNPRYNARPGGPARSFGYIAIASEGGAVSTLTIPANTSDGKTVRVTPIITFAFQSPRGHGLNHAGTMTFYAGMPKMVPGWIRTILVAAGLVT